MKEFQEKVKDIQERVKVQGLVINRVPKNIRDEFVKFAEEEFCDDYGMTLKYVWDNFKVWKTLYENMDYKLNHILELLTQNEQKPEEEKRTMLNGRKLDSGRKVEKMKGGKK